MGINEDFDKIMSDYVQSIISKVPSGFVHIKPKKDKIWIFHAELKEVFIVTKKSLKNKYITGMSK